MGIDGIRNRGVRPEAAPSPEVESRPPAAGVQRPFSVGGARAASAPEAVPAQSTALERLRAGELDLQGYLDAKVDEATRHLASAVPAQELASIRSALRDRIAADPSLADLVRAATGSDPPPSHEG